jgi:hypothetical protein
MKKLIPSLLLLACLYSCKPTTVVIPTYVNIDSATGNYSGTWVYMHHAWQNHVRTLSTDSSYNDVISVAKIGQDSIQITSKMGRYSFKFDGVSNSYSNNQLMEYNITPVSRSISATEDTKYWDNSGNADTVMYQFSGKR